MTDADGSVRWSGDYSSFGAVNEQTQDSEGLRHGKPVESQPLRYAGQYADEETGLHYNLFRYYDPTVGRFTTQDPIGLAGGINLYQYAPNPLGWVDPLGLTPTWVPASEVNYSQRTVSNVLSDGKTTIADLSNSMKENGFNLAKGKPLNVMVVDGQYVSYDNRRLLAAQNAGIDVPINIVNSEDIHPDSTTGKTWGEKFRERRNHKWNKIAGGVVPEKGISNKPTCL
jgi:RHS repeat-associated protein